MDPLKQIDEVFFWIKKKIETGGYYGYHNIETYVTQTPELNINQTLLKEIIRRLKDDGYISEIIPPGGQMGQPVYNVTFNGLTFDGYVKAKQKADAKDSWERSISVATIKNATFLNWLTIWLVIFTAIAAIYYSIEIYKYVSSNGTCNPQ